ncbi:hypothetical protein K1719_025173 [Acacia pycnantha]|nr:hypothetical protein K1719_025173 [Acacia pycnantha]
MALELGLKVTKTSRAPDNATSVSELRISKNTASPVFVSTETHSSFILTCYLKGYDRNSFQIKISENGKEISIRGEKPIQEMLIMGRVMLKKNVQIVGFKKVFEIPKGVVLDRIKAKFDEDESLLKIVMPKLVKGICRVQIEEVKKEEFGESSQKASSETRENECVCRKEEGLSDKKLGESSNGDVIEGPRFEAMKESELRENTDHIPENIGGENIMLGRPHGTTREDEFEGTPKEEIGEVEFGNGGKDEEEMSKKGFEAIETSKEEEESKKVFAGEIEELKSEAEDRGEQREETEEAKFECEGKDKERVSKGGLEAIDTTKEETESEGVLAGAIRVDEKEGRIDKNKQREVEEAKLETEGKDEEMEGRETTTKEAIVTRMEGVEPKKVHGEKMEVSRDGIEQKEIEDEERERESEAAKFEIKGKNEENEGTTTNKKGLEATESKIGVSEEDRVEETEQRETDETKFEIEDRDKENVEQVLKGTPEKEIENNEFAVEGRDEERMGPEIMEQVEAIDATIEGGVSEKLFSDAIGVSEKDIVEVTNKREIGENEQLLKEEISKEDFEARKTKIKEPHTQEPKLSIQLEEGEGTFEGIERGEDKSEGKKVKEIEELKIPECATSKGQNFEEIEETTEAERTLEEAKGEEPKISKEGSKVDGNEYASDSGKREIEEMEGRETTTKEAIETRMEGVEPKKGHGEKMELSKDGIEQKEIEDEDRERESEAAKFEIKGKDEEKVGTTTESKIGVSEEDKVEGTEQTETDETKFEIEDRDKEKVEQVLKGTCEKEIENNEFSVEGRDEEGMGPEIIEQVEAKDATIEGGVFEKLFSDATWVSEKDIVEGTKKREIGENEQVLKEEISKEDFEARKTKIEEPPKQEPKLSIQLEESEGIFEGIERGEDKSEGEKVKEIEKPKIPECATSKGQNFKEIEEPTEAEGVLEEAEGEEPKMSKEASKVDENDYATDSRKREIEEMEGRETTTKEAIETRMEGLEPKKVHGEKQEVSKDGIEQKEIEDEDRERESAAAKFEIKGKDEEKVGATTDKKGLEAIESKIGVSEEDRVEGTEQRKTDETKFEIEDRDKEKVEQVLKGTHEKEIENNEFLVEGRNEERMRPEIMEQVEAKDATIEGGVSEKLFSDATGVSKKDIVEGTKKKEIGEHEQVLKDEISKEDFEARKTKIKEPPTHEPKLSIQLEESEGTFEGIERGEDKSEGKKVKEIEEPKIPECATSKGQNFKEIEEPTEAEGVLEEAEGEEPKMSKEASKVDENDYATDSRKREIEESVIRSSRDGQVQEVFEELGTDTSKFPKQMSETNAQGEKEVKVKEEITVTREKEVKVKEVIVKKYDEAKEGFGKATSVGRIQLETGQPSDGRGFDNETLEAAKWDKTKACEEGYVETEPSMEDNKRERIQKETEDPRVETKHKAQHLVQELPKKIAESMDEREGPKDTKKGEMKEAKRKSEETQVVANESTIEKQIREAELERISQTNQFEKSLLEVPEAKDREALRKDMREREVMMSTQHSEVKEIVKVCEECKRSEANLGREKWRTTRSVKDEKPRRENAVKHLEDKVPYPELKKEEVEGARLKELPPPKVREQRLDSPESEKKNMKWKSPKTKKLAPEATEGEEYEAGKPPEVQSSSSSQQSTVDKEMFEIEIPKSNTSGTPSEEKEIEHFKTLTEDRGHYLLETEKRLEAKEVAEEEKLNHRDEEETLSWKRERTKIAECKDEKSKTKRNGSEEINQIKAAAEEFRDVLADNETGKSQEILLPQTAEIQGKEKISEIRQVQQEKRREIPFQASEESEAVISNREAKSQKPNDAHPKESTIKFDSDKPKGKVDNGRHLEFQEPEKQESELDFQESTRRRSDQEVEKTHFSKQEENHEGHAIEEEKAENVAQVEISRESEDLEDIEGHAIEEEKAGKEAKNVAQVEISQESEDLEDIEVEASGKKVELCVPMVFAGSVFIASLIIFFFGSKGAQKR